MAYVNVTTGHNGFSTASLEFKHSELTADQLRGLKLLFPLDVPKWQRDSDSDTKSLEGTLRIKGKDWDNNELQTALELRCTIYGAYVCRPVEGETVEEQPPSYDIEEATELQSLTDEQKIAYVNDLAAKKAAPKTRPKYECVPVELADKEQL